MDFRAVPRRLVVVGAGMAGLRTLAELRAAGYDGHLTILGAEGVPPYDRPPLSKELLSRTEPAWLSAELGADVHDLADDVLLDSPARRLLVTDDGVRLALSDGRELEADGAVLACGSHAVRPAGWEAALTLHTAADAEQLRSHLAPGVRLVIIGAGWIGGEVAGVAAAAGCEVTVLEAGPAPLVRQLGAELGARTVRWYAEAGVALHLDARVVDVATDGVRVAGGRSFPAEVVLCAVGARPTTDWLTGSIPMLPTGHVPVDGAGASDVPGVWAVGDCAARENAKFGPVPGGHWSAALIDPAPLARELMGLDSPVAEPAPYVYSAQLGHNLAVFGRVSPGELVTRGDPAEGPWTTLTIDDGVLTGAVIADRPRDVTAVRKLLRGAELPRLDPRTAGDESVNLRSAVVG